MSMTPFGDGEVNPSMCFVRRHPEDMAKDPNIVLALLALVFFASVVRNETDKGRISAVFDATRATLDAMRATDDATLEALRATNEALRVVVGIPVPDKADDR